MAKTIDDIFSEYRLYLLGLQPTANVDQRDSDHWIRGRVFAGVLSGAYSDADKLAQDAFPQHARREALLRHKFAWFNESSFSPATVAVGPALVTGDPNAGPFSAGLQMTFEANGNLYVTTEDVTLDPSGNGTVDIQSVLAGQNQNLEEGAELSIGSPPSGLDGTATVGDGGLSDGTNEEDEDRASARILNRMRSSARGGNDNDYIAWALEASPAVTDAVVLRYPNGLGTVGVIISSGTTDIDTAIDNNETIDFEPSEDLIDEVQDYIEAVNTTTACAFVYGAVTVEVDVTVTVSFTSGDKDTVLSGQTLTQGELVEREVKRAIYKAGTGGTKIGTQRFLTKKAIEDMIDARLSATDEVVGETLQIVTNREVADLDSPSADFELTANQRPIPGTIVIVDA